MEWPVCSPDLNPIEHVWDMLGRRIAARPRPPATVRDLEIALLEEWNSIPQSLIDNLIASMANRIIGRLECGRTLLEVSEELEIASVISWLWQRFQEDGNVSRCYSTGRPRVTMPNEDRYLEVTAKRNRRSTASDLSRQLSSDTGTTVSRQTVYRRLGHIGLYARRPFRCFPTSPNLVCSLILAGL
ncbi:transposable element Tc3 transposase [Trichonephila clavipes]|nr:transposable element Tc3 transposase [Trichonephila clavipes]